VHGFCSRPHPLLLQVWGSGFRISRLEFLLATQSPPSFAPPSWATANDSGLRVQGLRSRVQGFQGLGFRVQGLGFLVQGLGFRV